MSKMLTMKIRDKTLSILIFLIQCIKTSLFILMILLFKSKKTYILKTYIILFVVLII